MASDPVDDLLLCYLEAAFHATLCVRGVYPPELFEPRKVLNIPVRISRHPALKSYVREAVLSIREAMQLGAVEKVELVVLAVEGLDPRSEPVPFERHVFELGPARARGGEDVSDDELEAIERSLTASLSQISRLEHKLDAPSGDCTFAIVVHTPEACDLTRTDDLSIAEKWIHEDASGSQASAYREVHAVKQISHQALRLSHYVEIIASLQRR
jgi:hypothetical protein